MGNESSSEATGNMLRLHPVSRPVWTRPETKKPEFAPVIAKAETLVHRLDSKIDALHDCFVALVQDGTFARKMLFRVSRCLEAVESQAESNKDQIGQIAEEMNQAEKGSEQDGEKARDDWTSTLEALNRADALSKDADDVLADCNKMREALYVESDRPLVGFKKFRTLNKEDIEARPFVSALVQGWLQNVSPNRREHALEPEPAEKVEQFIERVLVDAKEGASDVMEHAHDAYCAALEKALLQKDHGAWIDVRDLDRKFESLVGQLDLSAWLVKVKGVVAAKQERQRAHFAALASGEAVLGGGIPAPAKTTQSKQRELERAWTDLVLADMQLADMHGPAPVCSQLKHIFEATANMTYGWGLHTFDPDLAPSELARSELARVAACLARAAGVVAEESADFVVHMMTDELKLAQVLFPGDEPELMDADLDLALLAFVRKLVEARKDNLRSHVVFAAYALQMAMQRLDSLERLDGSRLDGAEGLDLSASLSLWMEAELLVAGGDHAAADIASAAKQQVDKELAAVKRQTDDEMAATVQGLRDRLESLRATVDTLVLKTKMASPQSQALAQ